MIHTEREPFKPSITGGESNNFNLLDHIWSGAGGRQVRTEREENNRRRLGDATETGGHDRSPSNAGNPFGLQSWP